MTRRHIVARHFIAAAMLLLTAVAVAADFPSEYYDATLIWQNQETKAVGRLWLNPGGKYFAFYNLGPQARPPDITGPFQVQGREGSYTLRTSDGGLQLCLWVAAPRQEIGAEQRHELFSEARCYALSPHHVGEVWSETAASDGRSYKFWLVKGR
jgi:hypothetical protein